MAISVSLNDFTDAAQNAGGVLRVTNDGRIQKSSGLREHFPTREMKVANRKATVKFLDALKARFGEQIANMAAHRLEGHLNSGKPLTAHTVRSVVGKAEHLQRSLATFLGGATPDGQPVRHSLDKAIVAWQKEHPHEPRLTREERQAAKERMAENLLAGNPRCHNRNAMFRAVLNADLRPPRLSGNVEIPGAPKGAAAVAARAAAAEKFKESLALVPARQLTLHLDQVNGGESQPVFEKDLVRDMDLKVGESQVPNKKENLPAPPAGQPAITDPARAVAQNAYEHFARFLFGANAHFADLSKEQQKQVYLLAGLCNQGMQTPAKEQTQNGLLDQIYFGNASGGTSARIQLEKREDDSIVLHYSGRHALEIMSTKENPRGLLLDPGRSVQEVSVKLVISPGELQRLAALEWTGVSPENIPDTHRMRFEECLLDSRFALYYEGAEPDAPEAASVAAPEAASTVAQEAARAMDVFLAEMFPEGGKQPGETSSAFRTACEKALAGRNDIDIDRLNPTNYRTQVRAALAEANARAANESRKPSPEELHAAANQAIASELASLSETLKAIDGLTEPARVRLPNAGEFSKEQKALMKQVATRHNVRNLNVLITLMETARGQGTKMSELSALNATPSHLARNAWFLSTDYKSALLNLGNPPPPNGMNIMLELAAGNAGLDPGQLAANLESAAAATVAGTFLLGRDDMPSVATERKKVMGEAYDMLCALHDTAAILAHGSVEVDQKPFSKVTPLPLHQVPGSINGCMEVLSSMAGRGVISVGVKALAEHAPPFGQEEWNTLRSIADRLARGSHAERVAKWIAFTGDELLTAAQTNRGHPLNNAQVWRILTGKSMPHGVTDNNFADKLYESVLKLSGKTGEGFQFLTVAGDMGGLTPKRMLELQQPDAKLTRDDIHSHTNLSPPARDASQPAHAGFRKDFLRAGEVVTFTFTNASGNGHIINNTLRGTAPAADHPDLQAIIGWVNELTGGQEAQTAVVLHAMAQAGVGLNVCAGAFGVRMGGIDDGYAFSATQQQDGSVVVEVTHEPALGREGEPVPIRSRIQYTIHKDGSNECTGFEMQRVEMN